MAWNFPLTRSVLRTKYVHVNPVQSNGEALLSSDLN